MAGKRLQILRELLPFVARVAVLVNPSDGNAKQQLTSARDMASRIGVDIGPVVPLRAAADLEPAFTTLSAADAKAVIRMVDPLTGPLRQRTADLALAHRVPMIFAFRADVDAGGRISYGTNFPQQYRHAARLVDRILEGAKPADLPIELPTQFELTAEATRADQNARLISHRVWPLSHDMEQVRY
ncbi:MAG: ABC transporter substrate-binding protein [Hyphomicrobiaceae bacterium]